MSNQLDQLLNYWSDNRNSLQWVLATIIETQGSSYRKAGAMMLINSLGQYRGLLSGGCLEADVMRQARRCWETGKNRIICYDMRDEDDLSWHLGIGCGGMVRILLQPVSEQNDYLQLPALLTCLQGRQPCGYWQGINEQSPCNRVLTQSQTAELLPDEQRWARLSLDGQPGLIQQILPAPCLGIFGGGMDARPLVGLAAVMGWQVLLVDPRPANARAEYFPTAQLIKGPINDLASEPRMSWLSAAVLMTHNIELDAQALSLFKSPSQATGLRYLGMLGPAHRTERVFSVAGLEASDLCRPLANPVGLRLGGELPESIALSVIAEIHAVLEGQDARSFSLPLGPRV